MIEFSMSMADLTKALEEHGKDCPQEDLLRLETEEFIYYLNWRDLKVDVEAVESEGLYKCTLGFDDATCVDKFTCHNIFDT